MANMRPDEFPNPGLASESAHENASLIGKPIVGTPFRMVDEEPSTGSERGSSPASRGAAGAYIEGELGALYLLALLTGNRALGLPDARVVSIRFQGIEQGFKLDDLIVSGAGPAGESILEIQSKRDITFSPGDSVYRDVALQIAQSAAGSVSHERHWLGIATQRTSRKVSGAYQEVLTWAQAADNASTFFKRVGSRGVANKDMREFVGTTRKHLTAGGVADEDDAIWHVLRRLLILEFDFEATMPIARIYGYALARAALADEDVGRTEAFWSRLVDLSIKTGTIGGAIDRTALLANLAGAKFRLAGAREYGPGRAKLAEFARNTLAHIGTTVAGVHLPRLAAVAAVDDAWDSHRFIEVSGTPGIGKSWVLRHLAERVARQAPIIVLDRDATPPGGWLPFSNALGIPGSAAEFLNDLAASGGAALFIDGIDMFDDGGRQRTLAELMRAASAIPGFKVIATTRTAGSADGEPWLDDKIVAALGGAHTIRLEALSDDEVASLVELAPDLRSLLDPKHPATGLARNLYRLSRLLKVTSATEIRTEASMAGLWWRSADGAPNTEIRAAQRLLATLASRALAGETGLELDEDSKARAHLTGALTLREVQRDRLDFYHDVLRDWAIGNYIAENPARLADIDLGSPVSARVARGIEFAARLALESDTDGGAWMRLLERFPAAGVHGSWRRQAILALPRSEAGLELLERCGARLLAHEAALLIELSTTIAVVETVATADLQTLPNGTGFELPRSYRTDISGSALVVLYWVLKHVAEIPVAAIAALAELVEIQLFYLKGIPSLAERATVMLFGWLRQLDVPDSQVTIPGVRAPLGGASDARHSTIAQLRLIALLLSEFAPDQLKAYLKGISNKRNRHKVNAIRPFSKLIAPFAASEFADAVLSSLIVERKKGGHRDHSFERAFTSADSDYLPASPAQPPFLDLLERAPDIGLELIRTLVAEAVAFHTHGGAAGDDGFVIDFDDGPRSFPWTETYLWSRDQCSEYSAGSGLKALEAWSQKRLDDGASVDDVLPDILGPEGNCAAYLLVAIDVLLSHFNKTRDALAPFIASPELLATDFARRNHDVVGFQIDRFAFQKESPGNVRLADLRGRPSRKASLVDIVQYYRGEDSVANRLRERLGAAVAKLEPVQPYSDWGDPRFIARFAHNFLQRSNWIEGENGSLAYQSPADEAAQLEIMQKYGDTIRRSGEIEARISLAFDGDVAQANAATARDAVIYADGELPNGTETDVLASRSTRLITTALLMARDGDDPLLSEHEEWVRRVIAIALEQQIDQDGGSKESLRYNPPAIAVLALIHLWARQRHAADRSALLRLATRKDRRASPAFAAGSGRILDIEPKLFKAAMRAAFAGTIWRRKRHDERDEAEQARFDVERYAVIENAIAAEIAWLDGDREPAWPVWPEEHPDLRQDFRTQTFSAEPEEDEAIGTAMTEPPPNIHVDSKAAAQWLLMVQAASKKAIEWAHEVVEAYAGWTARMNGRGLPVDSALDRKPRDWNGAYYALFAERLLDCIDASFEADLKLVTDLPDQPFIDVADTVILSADALYFNDPRRPASRLVELRARLIDRIMKLRRWKDVDDPAASTIGMEIGGIVAKALLNSHGFVQGPSCYVPPVLFDRVDPLLAAMRPLLSGGPTSFVALCTMNLLLVAPRARHLDFLLEATETWSARTQAPTLWIEVGIGHKIIQWLRAAIDQDPGLLKSKHPRRVEMDRVLGHLVAVGVAEAREIELQVEVAREDVRR